MIFLLYDHDIMVQGGENPIGCLKLRVVVRKRATNYRALLRKMTFKDTAFYDSTPLCTDICVGIALEEAPHMGGLRL